MENKTAEMEVKDLLLADNQKKKEPPEKCGLIAAKQKNYSLILRTFNFQGLT